jgi:hypothetical protein
MCLSTLYKSSRGYLLFLVVTHSAAQYAYDWKDGTYGELYYGYNPDVLMGAPDVYPTFASSSLAWTPTDDVYPFVEV